MQQNKKSFKIIKPKYQDKIWLKVTVEIKVEKVIISDYSQMLDNI